MSDEEALRLAVMTLGEVAQRIAELETQVVSLNGRVDAAREQADWANEQIAFHQRLLDYARQLHPDVDALAVAYQTRSKLGAGPK